MVKKSIMSLFCTAVFLCSAMPAYAVQWNMSDVRFSINAYLDLEYTYMDRMPMVMNNMVSKKSMERNSTLDQNHLNILIDAQKENYRLHINIDSRHAYSSEDNIGHLKMEEVYGEYGFFNSFKLRAGQILSPFGIYNESRYITPLFATVVLPFMYELPGNYKGGDSTPFYPTNTNVMTHGIFFMGDNNLSYSLFAGNGTRNSDGKDTNRDKLVGGRIRLTLLDEYNIGFSSYTTLDTVSEGRRAVFAGDISLTLFDALTLEGEYAFDSRQSKNGKDRVTYYARAVYTLGSFTPFVAYDYFNDYGDVLYKRGISKASIGTGYYFSSNIITKIEYHYHWFGRDDGLPKGTDTINMVRTSMIFIL